MNKANRETLRRVLTTPAPPDVMWDDIELLLRAVQVDVQNRTGDLVALIKGSHVMVVRTPHDNDLTVRATVRDIAAYLTAVGVKR